MITKIKLDERALEYVRERLRAGHDLAKRLLPFVDVSRNVYALLPSDLPIDQASTFATGGKLSPISAESRGVVRIPNTNESLVIEIDAFIKNEPNNICVLENDTARVNYSYVSDLPDVMICGVYVYHVLRAEATRQRIRATLKEAISIPQFVAAMTSKSDGELFSGDGHHELADRDLDAFAERTSQIVVGAYDGESFIIVER